MRGYPANKKKQGFYISKKFYEKITKSKKLT